MDRDKQIEEMAKDYYEAMLKARGTLGSMNEGAPKWYAKELHNAGYRKASDVAEEIFAEIEQELLSAIDNNLQRMAEQEEVNEIWQMCVAKKNTLCGIYDFIAELKKKYAEDEG